MRGRLGPRMVVVIDRGPLAAEAASPRRRARPRTGSSRRCRADRARGCPGCGARPRRPRGAARTGRARASPCAAVAIGIAAPGEIGARRDRRVVCPAALVDQRLQAGAIGAGLGAEDAMAGAPCRRLPRDIPRASRASRSRAHPRGDRILRSAARPARRPRGWRWSSRSICAGKASRKKPEMRSVTSTRGRPSIGQRQDLEAGDAAGLAGVPDRA